MMAFTRVVLSAAVLLISAGAQQQQQLDGNEQAALNRAYDAIRDSFPTPLPKDSYSSCTISDNEPCALDAMPADETTMVYPGGETRCIFDPSISGDFGFQVIPGNSTKGLLLYWQGGGACWDEASTSYYPLCTTSAEPSGGGLFERDNDENPYRDWTVVHVLYCSGDVHGGQVVRDYTDTAGKPVQQTGVANTQAVIDWILSQEEFTGTQEVVLSGASAGCMGVQLWAASALEQLRVLDFERTAVIPDSFVGYFPPSTEQPLIRDFGYCDTPIISESLVDDCKANKLLFKEIVKDALGQNPDIPFAYINSKEDVVQISYYMAIAATFGRNVTDLITPSEYYAGINAMLEDYADSGHDNMLMYMISSGMHTYTDDPYLYTASTKGLEGGRLPGAGQTLIDFVSQLPMWEGETLEGGCDGPVVELEDRPSTGVDYCDAVLDGRTFTQANQQ